MNNNEKAYRKLLFIRNQLIFNQIDYLTFLKKLEQILFTYVGVNNIELAGGKGYYAYTTIAIRLLSDEIGKNHYLKNLKIDLTY